MQRQYSIRMGNLPNDPTAVAGLLRAAGLDVNWECRAFAGDTLIWRDISDRGISTRVFTWTRPDSMFPQIEVKQDTFFQPQQIEQKRQIRLED